VKSPYVDQSGWRTSNLGSVVKFISGGTPKKDEERYWNGNIPWVSSGEMAEGRIYNTKLNVSEDGVINGTKLAPKDTIFVVVRGMSLAKEFRVSLAMSEMTFNQDVKAIYPSDNIDPIFLFYYLKSQSNSIRDSASEAAHGTKKLDMPVLEQWPVPLPPLKTQKKIAAVLSSYDDLIENNKRRIDLLEKMAEEIYREWFVRFRFPGYQTASFEKGIPKGWHNDKANIFFDHVKGKSYKSDEILESDSNAMSFITLKSFNRGGGYRKDGLKSYSGKYNDKQVVFEGDVIMAVTDMTQNREVVGRVARVPDVGDKGAVISLDVIKLVPKAISATYLYSYMKYSGFGDFIKSFANGANVLHLKPDLVTQQVIVVPPEDLCLQFEVLVEPMHEQIGFLTKQIDSLEETRKSLLPRLISGKLSVEDLDIQFPPSMMSKSCEVVSG